MVGRKEVEIVIQVWIRQFFEQSGHDSTPSPKLSQTMSLMADYCGYMCGWKEPWDPEPAQRDKRQVIIRNYRDFLEYPSQTLVHDEDQVEIKKYFKDKNKNNVFSDAILALTQCNPFTSRNIRKNNSNSKITFNKNRNITNIKNIKNIRNSDRYGWYLGNPVNGHWYQLGNEIPKISHLRMALKRNSMATAFSPRTNKLYFAGGYALGMPVSSLAQLDLDTMKVRNIAEMERKHQPRAYASMVFWPDNICSLIGGTNCWGDVYNSVLCYNFETNKYSSSLSINSSSSSSSKQGNSSRSINSNNIKDNDDDSGYELIIPKLKNARYGHSATIVEDRSILVAGGCNQCYSVLDCEMYFRAEGVWKTIGKLEEPMQNCQSLRYCFEKIVMVGGNTKQVQHFEISKNIWTIGRKLNLKYKNGTKICTINGKLIAAERTNLSRYEIYDKCDDRWILTNSKNHPLDGFHYYPNTFDVSTEIIDWYHLGRRYW